MDAVLISEQPEVKDGLALESRERAYRQVCGQKRRNLNNCLAVSRVFGLAIISLKWVE